MLQEFITSFKDNLKEKSANPFFGTLILVWLLRNWKLVFGVFNFDKDTGLEDKLKFVSEFFEPSSFLLNFFTTILYTFLALILSFALLSLSRLIVNFFDRKVTPWVYQITDKSSVVLKSDFDHLVEEKRKLEERIEVERAHKVKVQQERDELEKKLFSKSLNGTLISDTSEEVLNVKKYTESIVSKSLQSEFEELIRDVANERFIEASKSVDYFIQLGIIEKNRQSNSVRPHFKFTKLGEKVKQDYVERFMVNMEEF